MKSNAKRTRTTVLVAVIFSGVILLATTAQAASKHGVIYSDDIDGWKVEVFAGCPNAGGALQGPVREAGISTSGSICFLPNGEGYLSGGGVVMMITKDKVVRLFAGTPGVPGYQDGPVTEALLGKQVSICSDRKGGFYLGDRSNRCIRRMRREGKQWIVETVAGDPAKPEWKKNKKPVDGVGKEVIFRYLHANVVADNEGTAYIMDENFLRKISPAGKVETLNMNKTRGRPEKNGPLDTARFNLIMGGAMAWDGSDSIYVADRWNFCIQKVNIEKKTSEIVAGPNRGYKDGPADKVGFHGGTTHIVYDPYRKKVYATGADDWGLRALANGEVRTIAGGMRKKGGFEGPAKLTEIHWCGVKAVDPRPPHDIYFHSNGGPWRGLLGRLYKVSD